MSRFRWNAEKDAKLLELVSGMPARNAKEWHKVGQAMGTSGNACSIQWARLKQGIVPSGATNSILKDTIPAETEVKVQDSESYDPPVSPALHVKKLHVHVPPSVTPASTNGMLTAVLYGDTHFPFQDDRTLRVVAQIIRVSQPDVVCHMGDLLDCYHLSRFDKNPKRVHGLQGEIDAARAHLAAFRLLAPHARFLYLEGNHEDRLRRTLWNMPPQAEALMALDAVQGALTWPKLLGLEELGIEFYPYGEQSKQLLLPKWLLKHGSVVRKLSGYTARAELDKYNVSGSSGHTHRLGMFFHRDHNGNHCWVETGCTCQLNPEYVTDPDWQAGCVVVTFEPTTGAFQAEPVYIHNGNAVFRGKFYDTKEGV